MIYQIKKYLQLIFRGYSDEQMWNLDKTIANYSLKQLIRFKKAKRYGYPANLTVEEWEAILDKMILGFELYMKEYDLEYTITTSDYEKIAEGLDLFRLYFRDLWD